MYCIFKNNRYLSPAKLSSNTMKKKKKLFQLWSGPTQTHHNFFDLKILINPHPLLVDELQRIQRMVDLVKEMRQDIFHRAASESNTPCLIILHLPRSLFSYKDVGGEW